MIVLDANILLYAYDVDALKFANARDYLEEVFSGIEMVGIPSQSISAFLRISTQKGPLRAPYSMKEAIGFVEEWLALPNVRLLVPGDRYWPIFSQLIAESHVAGRSVTDAEIAAVTLEYGGELQTNDRGFARFPGLRWRNPLAKA